MAVMAVVVVEVFTAAVVVEVFTAAAVEASTAVEVSAAITAVEASAAITVVDPTAAITVEHEKVRCMGVVAATEAAADFRHRRVIPAQRALGRGTAGAGLVTLRLVGMHSRDRATPRARREDPALEA